MDEKYPIINPDEQEGEEKTILGGEKIERRGHPRFYKLLEEMGDLHSRKNANYNIGQDHFSNIKESEKFGVPGWKGTLVRMGDKWNRIISLAKGNQDMVGESMKDTLMDMAVYSLICLILLEENEKNKK